MKNSDSNGRKPGKLTVILNLFLLVWLLPQTVFAHCDSYDGPVIQDSYKAIENNDVSFVLKWVEPQHEKEITDLLKKTLKYKKADPEIYQLLERHFLETLVRVHREGEGEPFTGLKPAGSTSEVIKKTDAALHNREIEPLLTGLNKHISKTIREKYERVNQLQLVKDNSVAEGRAYVAAYVDYTHTVETLHKVLDHSGNAHDGHQEP